MVKVKMTTKYGAMATVIFAGISIVGIYFFRARALQRESSGLGQKDPRKLMRSMSLAVLHGGQLALKRLLEARADQQELDVAQCALKCLLKEKHPDYNRLQSVVAKLEMSGNEAIAVKELEDATQKARSEGRYHEAYENEMLLVEMLLYKGDFEKALKCDCLKHVEISDARRPLYKAILFIMLKRDKKEIKNYWQEFIALNQEFHCEPCYLGKESLVESQLHKLKTDFDEFQNVVKILGDDIEQAKKAKK